jgi:NAD(P)-dependent dehydrogenase (short-subunit alcohol dehydrogenase family)
MDDTRRVLVVTGGGRGIGAAVARLGGAQGYAVCVNYRERDDDARKLVAALEASGGRAIAVRADVGSEQDVVRLFREVDERLGPVTALVNNAAIVGKEGRVDQSEVAVLADLWNVNVTGSFLCAREAILRMSTRHGGHGGAIVNVSSMVAKLGGGKDRVHYGASKGAINAFTLGLAKEVVGEGIRVNAVAPGLTDTGIHDAYGGAERVKRLAANVPMGRAGTPEESAYAILWLRSSQATYVTGTILEVGGGK